MQKNQPFLRSIKLVEKLRKKIHNNFTPLRGAIDPRILNIVDKSYKILRTPKNVNLTQMLTAYVRTIRAHYNKLGQRFCPSMIATVLLNQFKYSSAFTYMVHIQTHIHKSFRTNSKWKNMMALAHSLKELHPPEQAAPMTPDMIRVLIGDLSTKYQRAVLQIYTTASRFSESRPPKTQDGYRNLNVWKASYYKKHKMVRLFLRTHKAATKGQRPYSKWLKVKSKRHAKLYLKHHHVDYYKLLNYIKQHFPQHSVHSLRRGAIQRLQALNFQPKEIAILSGHNNVTKIATMNRTYAATEPHHKAARLSAKLSSALSKEVFPKAFHSRR